MASLRLHHELYSKEAINASAQAFAEFAEVSSKDAMPYYEVELSPKDGDEAELSGEFLNYVLALTVEERRGGDST